MNVQLDPRATPPGPEQQRPPAPVLDEAYYRRGEQARRWGGILILIGLVWLVFAIGSRAPLFAVGFVERTVPIRADAFTAERVVVTGVGDNVELVGWNGEGVRVEGVKHGFGWNAGAATDALNSLEVELTPSGDTLLIEVRRPIGAIVGRAPYADLRISLPTDGSAEVRVVSGAIEVAEVRGDLTLGTVSGDIDSAETSGSLAISTTSGDVEVDDHSGPITAESVSGDLQLAGRLENPTVQTVSGDASLEGAAGTVKLNSISGDLRLNGATLEGLTIESTSGDIEAALDLAEDSSSRISNISGDVQVTLGRADDLGLEVTTTSGELSTDLSGFTEERRSLKGALGDGSAALTISTTSGDVEVSGD